MWIITAAALVLGGGAATTVVFINQATQAAEHKAALTKHADAITAYEAAWTEFDRQSTDTRDDHGQLSMTSLDNIEEVNESFTTAIAAADELEHHDFIKADPSETNEQIGSDTQHIEKATSEVRAVTKQLADASALFLDSHRQTMVKSLTNEIEKAEQILDASRDTGDAELVAQLEQAISDAQVLADDPKAHPADLRTTMENLNTLSGKVKDSAGPRVEDIADGEWSILPGESLGTGGAIGLFVEGTQISMIDVPSGAYTGPAIFVHDTPTWSKQGGCLRATGKVHRHSQLWFCPAGTPVPVEAHENIYSLKSGDQTEDVSRDRLIGNWFMYLK
ncbi:hypothetical protein D3230_10125 [Leucobacter chromiireducens subsp. solipictus]|uniref:Uncharacterized protein n=1 Tax=Leucobacter chromiireducens subsp. solipictus TaxID=398235 RepID=A0ABS1SGV5_9MICO|nr:hypothetical protein [Leucobacter chromiireducens subsp. solipictus]